jgi:hypothetical protein
VSPSYPSGQLHEVVNFDKSLEHSPPFIQGLFRHGLTGTNIQFGYFYYWMLQIIIQQIIPAKLHLSTTPNIIINIINSDNPKRRETKNDFKITMKI